MFPGQPLLFSRGEYQNVGGKIHMNFFNSFILNELKLSSNSQLFTGLSLAHNASSSFH